MTYTIEIDCAPGMTRPNDLFPNIIAAANLELDQFELMSRFFGNFIWTLKENNDEKYEAARPVVKEKITELYNSGVIRYGSW